MADKFLTRIDELAYATGNKFEQINIARLKTVANHIREIGRETPVTINPVREKSKAYDNIREMDLLFLAFCIGMFDDIGKEYTNYAKNTYNEQENAVKNIETYSEKTIPYEGNLKANMITDDVIRKTQNSFINISRTTVTSQEYIKAIDKAVETIQSGQGVDYDKQMASALRELSDKCNRVKYASGITRRLDSAVRMNIYEGARRIQREINQEQAQRLGMDAVVISAHADCAPDHLEIQGQKYTLDEYQALNDELARPIGTLNCRHYELYTFSFLDNPYSDEYVEGLREQSTRKLKINGRPVTKYRASQMMRELETRMRYTLDRIKTADFAGNEELRIEQERLLATQRTAYTSLCKQAGYKPQWDRVFIKGVNY